MTLKNLNKTAYIETFGCQMNERDSEIMAQLLDQADIHPTMEMENADVVIVNTCSIREKAEQKAFSLLGRLRKTKEDNPSLLIAVTGCVAQQEGKRLFSRLPFVDLVVGPQNIYRLPELLSNALTEKRKELATSLDRDFSIPPFLPAMGDEPSFKRFVTIMQGCNNFCTYCVVPYTRGREVSRKLEDILEEIRHLAAHGIREVTLLGQNVNSYGLDRGQRSVPTTSTFPKLLRAVHDLDGIERIRFTTSHPKDLSSELIGCFGELAKLCPHFHLPVQSGSDLVLKRMNRHYTIETYLEKVAGLRLIRPDIAISTDIIVGFPGETDTDFAATMALLDIVRYHSAFSFKYSDRPTAKAAAFSDKIPEPVKVERLAHLQKRQEEITLERNQESVGQTIEVMVEGESRVADGQWSGRAGSNQIVNFLSPTPLPPGLTVQVRVLEGCLHSLRGELIPPRS